MNALETYVNNITSKKEKEYCFEIVADFDCYGHQEFQKKKIISKDDMKMIEQKGYYMT